MTVTWELQAPDFEQEDVVIDDGPDGEREAFFSLGMRGEGWMLRKRVVCSLPYTNMITNVWGVVGGQLIEMGV